MGASNISRKVVSKVPNPDNFLRWILTLECGHTVDAVNHQDKYVVCLACMGSKGDDAL